ADLRSPSRHGSLRAAFGSLGAAYLWGFSPVGGVVYPSGSFHPFDPRLGGLVEGVEDRMDTAPRVRLGGGLQQLIDGGSQHFVCDRVGDFRDRWGRTDRDNVISRR